MTSEDLRHLQLVMLQIAKDIKKVCDENDIKYFLDSGSLLGAVRHGGFIPWDDDFDIGMTRENFEKFCKIGQEELGNKYFVQTWDSEKYYGRPLAKVRLNNTQYIEASEQNNKINHGIFVDILPYDKTTSKKAMVGYRKKLTRIRSLIYCKCGYYNERSLPVRIITKVLSLLLNKKYLVKKYEELATKFNKSNSGYLYAHTGTARLGTWIMPKDVITELEEIEFEDTTFSAPKNYDKYLKNAYGDYMVLPDESKRVGGHGVVFLEFGNY